MCRPRPKEDLSFLRNGEVLNNLHGLQVIDILSNRTFWIFLDGLCQLLEPLSQVVKAIQATTATLADVTRYWLYLGRAMRLKLPISGLPSGAHMSEKHFVVSSLCLEDW